ncbi:hypothetical protein M3Y99_00177800 [Aphelenchoides fujianensis]|nr:hypothetical protein M3Y99_00177800 [Aphelenchoides fujianensis]
MSSQFGGQKAVDELDKRMKEANINRAPTYEEECIKYMTENNIQPGSEMIENRPQPATNRRAGAQITQVSSNVYKARPTAITVYQYEVKIAGHNTYVTGRDWESFTDASSVDFFNMERRAACEQIYEVMRQRVGEISQNRYGFYYDRRQTLYSTVQLKKPIEFTFSMNDLIDSTGLDREDANQMAPFRNFNQFQVVINEPQNNKTFTTDLSVALQSVGSGNREFAHFLDVASSQAISDKRGDFVSFPNGAAYFMDPAAYGYANDKLELNNGVYLAAGVGKSARLVSSNSGGCTGALVVEPKLSPFHSIQTVAEKVEGLNTREKMLQLLRGLYVYPAHLFRRSVGGTSRLKTFKIVALGPRPADHTFEDRDGNQMTVLEYFKKAHNYVITKPDLPTIEVENKASKRTEFYPMEVCEVLDNQRLGTAALTGEITSAIIRIAAMHPVELSNRVQKCVQALDFNSEYMRKAQIQVDQVPVQLEVPILKAPEIMNAEAAERYNTKTNKFKLGNFVSTPRVGTAWAVYGVCRMGQRPSQNDLNTFVGEIVHAAKIKGMDLQQTYEVQVLSDNLKHTDSPPTQLREKMLAAKTGGCRIVMVITSLDDTKIHGFLKSYEQEMGMLTQNQTWQKLRKTSAFGGPQNKLMFENIVHKMNMKLGGLNYTLQASSHQAMPTDLIVGIAVNRAAGGRGEAGEGAPSVIGYAANDGGDPTAFTGDYVYQPASRGADLGWLEKAVSDICERRLQRSDNQPPERVIIFRNGVSEGDYSQVLRYEIPVIRKMLRDHFGRDNQLTYVVCTRLHNARFWLKEATRQQKNSEANVPAGTVIDTQVVHPTVPEFFISTCRSQMGTAKIPRYAVLHNSLGLSMEIIQQLTMNLAFAHQIVGMPTSTPSPIYIAEEYAKRGRNLLNARSKERSIGDSPAQLNDALTYKKTDIRGQRVNA